MSTELNETLEQLLADNGIEYTARFVPQSMSRNRGAKHPSINWICKFESIGKPAGTFACDYMQGIGHIPGYKSGQRKTPEALQDETLAAEHGQHTPPGRPRYNTGKLLPVPELADVLYCLVSDYSVLDAGCFEDWAADCGANVDSRADEKLYRECVTQALSFRAVFGNTLIRQIANLTEGM